MNMDVINMLIHKAISLSEHGYISKKISELSIDYYKKIKDVNKDVKDVNKDINTKEN